MRKMLTLCPCLVVALLAQGCGGKPTGKLTGTITFKDKPVDGGTLTVVTEDGREPTMGKLLGDGNYVVEQAPVGNVKISFKPPMLPPGLDEIEAKDKSKLSPEITAKMKESLKDKSKLPGLGNPGMPELTPEQRKKFEELKDLPERYASWQNSGLTTTITANQDNTYNIKLLPK